MNPTSNEGMQLPPPIMEQPLTEANPAEHSLTAPEQAPAAPERATTPQPPPAQVAVPAITLPLPPTAATSSSQVAAVSGQTAASALDDNDLIEKEWVNKAKQIVALNREDPFKQSEELTVFRADYMKKHYDKHIKLSK